MEEFTILSPRISGQLGVGKLPLIGFLNWIWMDWGFGGVIPQLAP